MLVKIHTAAVNPLDNMIMRGEVKLITPYALPLVMGNEFSGVVEKVSANVTGFAVGDRVYGRMPLGKIGAFAELRPWTPAHWLTSPITSPWRKRRPSRSLPSPPCSPLS